jgi:putative ABC transport system permease protein
MALSLVFSGVALLLAAIGIYGVMTFSVAQRTGEIGIRMALGAQRGDVLQMILVNGGRMVGLGLIVGVLGALAVTRVIGSLLYKVSSSDPATLAGITLMLTVVGFLACWIPARRATNVDPLVALRTE